MIDEQSPKSMKQLSTEMAFFLFLLKNTNIYKLIPLLLLMGVDSHKKIEKGDMKKSNLAVMLNYGFLFLHTIGME
ncbi:MAG: hypothetical protein ACTSP9_13110 [Promethearchaeota archaeon]